MTIGLAGGHEFMQLSAYILQLGWFAIAWFFIDVKMIVRSLDLVDSRECLMKVRIQVNPEQLEPEVIILCHDESDQEVQRVHALLDKMDSQLSGKKDGSTVFIKTEDILYIDSVDKKAFIYTENDVFETSLRLYMLEERLTSGTFFRASKNTIINLNKIESLKPEFGGRMEATLISGERLMISRQYLPHFKSKIEM